MRVIHNAKISELGVEELLVCRHKIIIHVKLQLTSFPLSWGDLLCKASYFSFLFLFLLCSLRGLSHEYGLMIWVLEDRLVKLLAFDRISIEIMVS